MRRFTRCFSKPIWSKLVTNSSMSDRSRTLDPRNQLAAGGFLALWSLAGWWSMTATPALWSEEYGADPGPGLLPMLVLTILSLGAVILVVDGTRRFLLMPPEPGYWAGLRRHTLVPVLFLASLLVLVTAIDVLGFIMASGGFAFAWMVVLGYRSGEGAAQALLPLAGAGALIGVGLIYFVFVYLIGVPIG